MRKPVATILTLSMAAMMGFGLVACGGTKPQTTENTQVTTEAKEDQQADISKEFKQLMIDVMEKDTEEVAKEIENFVYEYGEDLNFQSLAALAAENAQSMLEENDNLEYSAPYSLKMEAVAIQCLEDDADLETDTAFNQVVNAINDAIENMHNELAAATEETTEEVADADVAAEFEQLMNDVMDKDTEEVAKEIENFATAHADKVNTQNLTALAQENVQKMLDANDGLSYSEPYLLKLEAVTDKCYANNPDLETDVTFNQIINAITDAVADM